LQTVGKACASSGSDGRHSSFFETEREIKMLAVILPQQSHVAEKAADARLPVYK
jgi:hypothetical protein